MFKEQAYRETIKGKRVLVRKVGETYNKARQFAAAALSVLDYDQATW